MARVFPMYGEDLGHKFITKDPIEYEDHQWELNLNNKDVNQNDK